MARVLQPSPNGTTAERPVEVTWWIYHRMIAAYRQPDRKHGRVLMVELIESIGHGVPAALAEIVTLGRTLKKRADDVLAYFDWPGASNRPTETINGRLEPSADPHSDSAA